MFLEIYFPFKNSFLSKKYLYEEFEKARAFFKNGYFFQISINDLAFPKSWCKRLVVFK